MIPIGKTREGRVLLLFTGKILAYAGWLIYGKVAIDTAIERMSYVAITATATTIIIVEGWEMLSEKYLQRRYEAGQREGKYEERRRWEAWLKDLDEKGERPKTPPPPPPPQS